MTLYCFARSSVSWISHKSVLSYFTESLSIYDDIDADVLRNYQEFTLANILYYSLKESTTSEQSARMTAMDNASKNACKSTLWVSQNFGSLA